MLLYLSHVSVIFYLGRRYRGCRKPDSISPDLIHSLHSSVNLPATEAMSPASPSTPEPDYSWREMAPKMHGQPAQKAALPKVPCQSIKRPTHPSATQAEKCKGCSVKHVLWPNGLCFECDRAVKACVVLIAP